MIKLAGTILLLCMSALAGSFAAQNLKERTSALRQARLLFESLRLMIRYEALEVTDIVERISASRSFPDLAFIPALKSGCERYMETGEYTFSEIWDKALYENKGAFTDEDAALLSGVGGILGSCDCEGQLSAISSACAEADRLIIQSAEQYAAKGRLYRALGAIAGALIAVIII